ncbi:MAG TPA: hypothetical protein VFS49_12795 [Croceibacterium sp.]|nr:hypothetical protein [Croceibacterium sp.]
MASQPALASGISPFHTSAQPRPELAWMRASGLAQARLQLAVLSGNRRRALEQIDRLIGIDRQLERLARGESTPAPGAIESDLAEQRLAIASEKLALASAVELPRLEPAFGGGMGAALAPEEPVEIVESETLKGHLARLALWASGFAVLCVGVAVAAMTQL